MSNDPQDLKVPVLYVTAHLRHPNNLVDRQVRFGIVTGGVERAHITFAMSPSTADRDFPINTKCAVVPWAMFEAMERFLAEHGEGGTGGRAETNRTEDRHLESDD